MTRRVLLLPAFLLLMLATTLPASAKEDARPGYIDPAEVVADPEPWSQLQGGASHLGAAPGAPEPPYEVAWRYNRSGEGGASTPVVAGDDAFAVTPEAVVWVDATTGEERGVIQRASGLILTPAVAEVGGAPFVMFTEGKGDETVLVGYDAAKGERAWEVELGAGSTTGVTSYGGLAYVGNGVGEVVAVDIATGEEVWTTDEPGGRVDGAITVSGNNVVYGARDEVERVTRVVAVDALSGERVWLVEPDVTSSTMFTADGDTLIAGASGFGLPQVVALDAEGGATRWMTQVRSQISLTGAVAVADGTAYVVDQAAGTYAIDADSGERRWDFQENGTLQLAGLPLVTDSYVLTGLENGSVVAVDRESGHLAWRGEVADARLRGAAHVGDLLIFGVGGPDGGLVALRHADGALLDEVSPTTLDPAMVASAFAVGLVGVSLLLFVLGRVAGSWLWNRGGGPVTDDDFDDDFEDTGEGA